MLYLGQESHFQFSVGINLEELFEALFENWVTKRVCHDVEAACVVKAGLHLQDTNLVKGRNE
jgi:hypothetical protein